MKKIILPFKYLKKYLTIVAFLIVIGSLQSCGGDGSPRIKEGTEETYMETTKGIITEIEEVKPGNDFKIIDEKIIDDKSKSIAIVHNLDGTIDTVGLKKLKDESGSNPRYHSMSNVLMFGLAASYLSRNFANTNPNSSYYKDQNAFNKSNGLKNDLAKSTTTRRVTVPSGASKGYGSGKSFRSSGG